MKIKFVSFCLFCFCCLLLLILSLVENLTPQVESGFYESSTTTSRFFRLEDNAWLGVTDSNYTVAWEMTTAEGMTDVIEIGQGNIFPEEYVICRSFLYFDTSSLPDFDVILDATLCLKCLQDSSDTADFNVTIQNGQPTYPHSPLTEADYNKNYYSGNGGMWDTVNFVEETWINISLTELSWINKQGTTKLALRSSRDINGITSSFAEYIMFSNTEPYEPYLDVTYTTPETAPNYAILTLPLLAFAVTLIIFMLIRKKR